MTVRSDCYRANEAQRQKLCEMLGWAFVHIRVLGWSGKAEIAADLADIFHSLPMDMWCDHLSLNFLRRSLEFFQTRHSVDMQVYLKLLDEVDQLR